MNEEAYKVKIEFYSNGLCAYSITMKDREEAEQCLRHVLELQQWFNTITEVTFSTIYREPDYSI